MKRLLTFLIVFTLMFSLSTAKICAFENAFEQDSSSGDSGFGDENTSSLEFSGSLEYKIRSILDKKSDSDLSYPINSEAELELGLDYSRDNSDIKATLAFDDNGDVALDEAFIRLYYDDFDLEAGKMKVVWGKGDKLHVVDNLNGEDLTDFINPEYLDRQIAENMVKLNYYLGTGKLEAVYTPEFTANKLDREGDWMLSKVSKMKELKPIAVKEFGLTDALEIEDSLAGDESNEFKDGQLALRYTNSKGGYDYGFSIYQGRLKNLSMDKSAIAKLEKGVYRDSQAFLNDLDLHYDEVTVLGAELSSVLFGINSRGELAYYLTDDRNGDDPTVHNNKLAWIIGGDRDLALHNVNVNLQVKSELILDKDKVDDNPADIDYSEDYFTNMMVLKVSDDFNNQRILPEVSLMYNLESQDYILDNQLEFIVKDDTSIKFNYKLFQGDGDTLFGQFDENDYISMVVNYEF
ncbi:hypothetical protein BX659_1191 [Orenia metallireducens]|jgi:hypothetical protein|uniref:Uncharacterized protein n=1 Tax=Orenia metallireducens TaxID=1413210 RepID=A0A285HJA8_9FIRM|nr:hypothetical protein [Orenia metallireducens]PRX26637.1 hypothetical protein BX659_1191 [Orenia metallireducens]SNY35757.1 hypothetical protein SAMN06265827_1201 [Orenia metallireducens]